MRRVDREREGEKFEESRPHAHAAPAQAAHDAVAGGRGVAFALIDFRDRYRQFGNAENQIGKAAAEFARRAVIIRGRILNIGEAGSCEAENRAER